jgi:cardiolipin synthase
MSAWDIVAYISVGIVALGILTSLMGDWPEYKVDLSSEDAIDSPEFLSMMEALTDAKLNPRTKLEVLTNGENFYPAEIAAIRAAQKTITLEAYIFSKGRVTQEYITAMVERAHAGVKVKVLIDAIGSFSYRGPIFRELIEAGGQIERYHPFNMKSLFRMNNRTHRELLIVDGRMGFIGGAGIGDSWMYAKSAEHPRWRDTMVRVEGDVVSNLQATFAENWLESSGEIIAGRDFFPGEYSAGNTCAMVVNGSPTSGGSSRSRVLFQVLMAAARQSIHITTPYFLPDASMRKELVKAVQRGVDVKIIVPGTKSDHMLTRTSSRMLYGDVLRAGGEIYEYQTAMIHAKVLLVDGKWSVVGSTNCDPRSFGLNDEVNLAALSPEVAQRLTEDFERDLAESKGVTLAVWERRPLLERCMELGGWLIRSEQ